MERSFLLFLGRKFFIILITFSIISEPTLFTIPLHDGSMANLFILGPLPVMYFNRDGGDCFVFGFSIPGVF